MRFCERVWDSIGMPPLIRACWVIVDIQNVQDYMRSLEDGPEDRSWNPHRDFPCWVSPWPFTQYEWRGRDPSDNDFEQTVAVFCERREDGTFEMSFRIVGGIRERGFVHLGEVTIGLDADGHLLVGEKGDEQNPTLRGRLPIDVYPDLDAEQDERLADLFCSVYPIAMANSLLACSNVTVREQADPQTRHERRHGPPAITYKVLDIGPMTRVLRDEGESETLGIQRALHICRGHFAHYGPEHPLFGKYEGSFWIPMHTRGNPERGVVVKDYRVKNSDLEGIR